MTKKLTIWKKAGKGKAKAMETPEESSKPADDEPFEETEMWVDEEASRY